MSRDKNALGKGLSALISDSTLQMIKNGSYNVSEVSADLSDNTGKILEVPLDHIQPNIGQPRHTINQEELQELADSISKHGILQPILVSEQSNGFYQIIAGERRWRAARLAGFYSAPVIVKNVDINTLFEISIIENIQREDLKPLEESAAYHKLINEFGYTQEVISARLGKSRSHVTNMLRLLKLPQHIQDLVNNGQISAGHARAIISSEDPSKLVHEIMEQKLTVREAENLARVSKGKDSKSSQEISIQANFISSTTQGNIATKMEGILQEREVDNDILAIEDNVSRKIGMEVKICQHQETSYLVIKAENMKQLDDLITILNVPAQ